MSLGAGLGVALGRAVTRFSPSDLGSSLLAFWDAEATSSLTVAGSLVTTWTDTKAGMAPTQGVTGSKPAYSATSFRSSRPGVTFDGSDDELTLASQPLPSGSSPCEMWALVDQTALAADTTARCVISYGISTTTGARRLQRAVISGVNRAQLVSGDGALANLGSDSAVDLSGIHVVRARFTPTTSYISVDGGAESSVASVPSTGTTRVRLGATTNNTATGFWQGVMNAILVTSALTTDQATSLLTYLKTRGGLS